MGAALPCAPRSISPCPWHQPPLRRLREATGGQGPSVTCLVSPSGPMLLPREGWGLVTAVLATGLFFQLRSQPAGESPLCQAALREAGDIMAALLGRSFPSPRVGNLRRELNGKEKPSRSFPPPSPVLCAPSAVPDSSLTSAPTPRPVQPTRARAHAHACAPPHVCVGQQACRSATRMPMHKHTGVCPACTRAHACTARHRQPGLAGSLLLNTSY